MTQPGYEIGRLVTHALRRIASKVDGHTTQTTILTDPMSLLR